MRKYLIAALLLTNIPAANADGYAKVDANGNQIGGVIVCDAGTCGNPDSLYSRLTLQPGERYVLQSKTDSKGNVAGINPSENTKVKVDIPTTTWTVETKTKVEVVPDVAVEVTTRRTFNPTVEPAPQPAPIVTPTPTPTPTTDTSTATSDTTTDSETVTTDEEETEQKDEIPEPFTDSWWAWLVAILRNLFGINI